MEIYALNLPQFHEIPENNKWCGNGFTEWENVKKAKPLYRGHVQPLVPYNNKYYDLSRPEAIIRQHQLGKQYGLTGFVYYHYWFNGKLLLQKPIELLLSLPEANLKFSLCWANESWTRAWDGKQHEVIMEQTFGGKEDWLRHIEYLSMFFKDQRYQRINGCPVLYIYSPSRIPKFDEMIEFWNQWLKNHGDKKLHLIEFLNSFNPRPYSKWSSAVFEFEPLYSSHYEISKLAIAKRGIAKLTHTLDIINYDYIWKAILNKSHIYSQKTVIRSGFTNFDNSPRKGMRAFITKGATPKKFEKYLSELFRSSRQGYCDITVINAWNEWGEGAILEPTSQYGYQWLEALSNAIKTLK